MAEVFREYPTRVSGVDDTAYVAQVWGHQRSDGRWEAWLVFALITRGPARRTERETTQSNRDALRYWAEGVTSVYLQGALTRSVPLRVSAA